MDKSIIKRSVLILSIVVLYIVFSAKGKVDAKSIKAERIYLTTQYGIQLYKHHVDQDGYCVMVNDIVLSESQMEVLWSQGAADSQWLIRRTNFLVRREYGMKTMKSGQAVVCIDRNSTQDGSGCSYKVTMEYVNDETAIQISSDIYTIEDALWEEEPEVIGVENMVSDEEENNSLSIFAFIAINTMSVIVSVCYGVSIYLDVKTIIWYQKKRIARREKRKCQR